MPFTFEPEGYACPFCRVVAGKPAPGNGTGQEDVIYRDQQVTAFIASRWWPNNLGHVLVIPNDHHENIVAIPDDTLAAVQILGKRVAQALLETYACDGVSFRQHNGPEGGQDVWHYHLHVYPRYAGDYLYLSGGSSTKLEQRLPYAEKLRAWFDQRALLDD